MKRILDHTSRRHGFSGWVVVSRPKPAQGKPWIPLEWTFSTTRDETRDLFKTIKRDLFRSYRITKARLKVEAIGT